MKWPEGLSRRTDGGAFWEGLLVVVLLTIMMFGLLLALYIYTHPEYKTATVVGAIRGPIVDFMELFK